MDPEANTASDAAVKQALLELFGYVPHGGRYPTNLPPGRIGVTGLKVRRRLDGGGKLGAAVVVADEAQARRVAQWFADAAWFAVEAHVAVTVECDPDWPEPTSADLIDRWTVNPRDPDRRPRQLRCFGCSAGRHDECTPCGSDPCCCAAGGHQPTVRLSAADPQQVLDKEEPL
jgi:hypothetical protein